MIIAGTEYRLDDNSEEPNPMEQKGEDQSNPKSYHT